MRKLCTYLAPTLTLSPNGLKWDCTRPMSLMSSIGCIQNYLWAFGTVQTVHLSCVKISTISKRTEQTSTRPSSLIHRVHLKWFMSLWYVWQKPSTNLAPTLTLSQNRSKRDSTDPRHLGVPSGASNTISKPTVHLTQTVHQSCMKSSTFSKHTEPSFHLSLIT
jgi:hypothetical protein